LFEKWTSLVAGKKFYLKIVIFGGTQAKKKTFVVGEKAMIAFSCPKGSWDYHGEILRRKP
jgi:hypothetical protein